MALVPTWHDVQRASVRIRPHVQRTPLVEFSHLNARADRRVFVKVETLQHSGAFKFRGAMASLTAIPFEKRALGVVAYSTGNHGMAIAEAARRLSLPATIILPTDTPPVKIERIQESGATIRFCDRYTDDGEAIARDVALQEGRVFIHPFDNADVIAGQGTLAVEMIEQVAEQGAALGVLLVNSAGGGFISGCGLALEALLPETRLCSVESAGWDAIRRSLQSGTLEDNQGAPPSVCDAIQARRPGLTGYPILARTIHRAIAVDDEQALAAVRYAFERLRLVVEPGGAVGLAAVLAGLVPASLGTIGLVLCGGNVDPHRYAEWITQA